MTKLEYLEKLENKLRKSMPQKEVNDIIRDYVEYFEDGKVQGKCDDEIAAKLGNPEMIAQQILDENGYDVEKAKKNFKDSVSNSWGKIKKIKFFNIFKYFFIGILMLFIIFIGFLLVGAVIVLLVPMIGVAFAAALALLCGGIALLIFAGIIFSLFNPIISMLALVAAIACFALGIFLIGITCMALVGLWKITKNLFFKSCQMLNTKSRPVEEVNDNE
ncbi:MAG: DUF1700 domain-containing protein [Oscillospiraceae bacterium]